MCKYLLLISFLGHRQGIVLPHSAQVTFYLGIGWGWSTCHNKMEVEKGEYVRPKVMKIQYKNNNR